MRIGRILWGAALVGATLAACGGGGDGNTVMRNQQAGQGIAVGEPNGGVPVVSEYIKLAQDATCASVRNKLYLVDSKVVLWDRAGNCADASASQTLMGATPQAVLCTSGDSIAGPRTSCTDASLRPLFDTMLQNLDKADLGLGAGHKVEAVGFLSQSGSPIAMQTIDGGTRSQIVTPRKVVVRDAAAWASLWAEHAGSKAPLPAVDFGKQMVIGVFLGAQPDGCRSTTIQSVTFDNGKLNVRHVDTEPGPGIFCTMAITYPAHLVAVARTDAPVTFSRDIHILKP